MGTDIHPIVEVRKKGRWTTHRPTTPYKYQYQGAPKFGLPDYFSDRNYFMFAVLGDVRNGYGFAGVKTFNPITPMSSNRGVPADVAAGTGPWVKEIDHSASWVSLAELETYDWTQMFTQQGVISEAEFIRCLVKQEHPTSWSGGITGQGIVTLKPDDYLALFGKQNGFGDTDPATRTYDHTKRYYIAYSWNEWYLNAAPEIPQIIEYLRALVPPGGTSSDVRLLFYFDS